MLPAEGDTDQKLDKLILNENDVAGLGLTLKEISIEESYKQFKRVIDEKRGKSKK